MIIDEADAFERTAGAYDESERNESITKEKERVKARALGPLIDFEATATLLAIFLSLAAIGVASNVAAAGIFFTDGTDTFGHVLCRA